MFQTLSADFDFYGDELFDCCPVNSILRSFASVLLPLLSFYSSIIDGDV